VPVAGTAIRGALRRLLQRLLSVATAGFVRSIDEVRAAYGLRPLNMRMTEYYSHMPLVLIPSSRSLDYSRTDIRESVRYIGACCWPALPRRRSHSGAAPRVVFAEGSLFPPDSTLVSVAVSAAADLNASVTIFRSKGGESHAAPGSPIDAHVSVRPWAPPAEWIGETDVLVTSGNTELVVAALSLGIPLVVVPSILDQAEMACRVVYTGAGLCLPERECTPGRLLAAVRRVLGDPAFRLAAERESESFRKLGGAMEGARLLEQLVHRRRRSPVTAVP
jgi:UDP:flavonoid glycosyltransferase YjiC (YdhE family)